MLTTSTEDLKSTLRYQAVKDVVTLTADKDLEEGTITLLCEAWQLGASHGLEIAKQIMSEAEDD